VRQEDVALGIDGQRRVELESTPQANLDSVAHRDEVIGVELGRPLAGESAGEQIGTEGVAVEVGRVIEELRRLGAKLGGDGGCCRGQRLCQIARRQRHRRRRSHWLSPRRILGGRERQGVGRDSESRGRDPEQQAGDDQQRGKQEGREKCKQRRRKR
jgi:hypothetical protein